MNETQLQQTEVELCMAVRAKEMGKAGELLEQLLNFKVEEAQAQAMLKSLQHCLNTFSRSRDPQIFAEQLKKTAPKLLELSSYPGCQMAYLELVNSLLFSVCDKKLAGTSEVLYKLCRQLFKVGDSNVQKAWVVENLTLIARINRRHWFEVSDWLLKLMLKLVWSQKNPGLLQDTLGRLELHMVLSARYDGMETTLEAYKAVTLLYLLLVKKSESLLAENREQAVKYLVLALRSLREWITNTATSLMEEELEVFEQWDKWLQESCPAEEKGAFAPVITSAQKKRIQLLQLEIRYWNNTKPKTSRKQMRYMQELLEPNRITPGLYKLLEEL